MFVRQNVYALGDDWAEPILWYARGVRAMKARYLDDVTSWLFYGGIHGYLRWLWDFHGLSLPGDPEPTQQDIDSYFDQCQHQSWFFLPWHRGYLFALERQIRHEIERLGGPHDSWALPYWNYFEAGQSTLPPAFRSPSWPDGDHDNPLFVEQRWGDMSIGNGSMFTQFAHLGPMSDREFSGPGNGGSTGFGGRPTGFNWSGGDNGGAEWQPHNIVHTLVGGQNPAANLPPPNDAIPVPGLMSVPLTAAADPIFYLHHCNIDRLWESWNSFPPGKPAINPNDWSNPTGADWLDGPATSGDREFIMPNPDGTRWPFSPREVQDLRELDYSYDNLTPGAAAIADPLSARVTRLGLAIPATALAGGVQMAPQRSVEMLGSSGANVTLSGATRVKSSVNLDPPAMARVATSLSGAEAHATLPDRVFLNLENVRSVSDSAMFHVYVALPEGAEPAESPAHLAGTISLFGATLTSDPNGPHAGNGITHVLEITNIIDELHVSSGLGGIQISVDLVPIGEIPAEANVEIGNISIYRQSE